MSFTSAKISYLYLISKSGFADYVTTSFEVIGPDEFPMNIVRILHLKLDDLDDFEYLTQDYTTGSFKNGLSDKYSNSENLAFYRILKIEIDKQRNTATLHLEKTERFDLLAYKRDVKIEKIIND